MTAHQARKRFGQNFLVDLAVVDAIVRAIAPKRDDVMIEIGPGLSAFTAPLLGQLEKLTAIEIDRDLAARLRRRFSVDRLTVVEADALQVDFRQFGQALLIVGNLPYNISSPLLFALADCADQRRKMLRGVLGEWTALIPWETLGVLPTWRAEQVSVAGFVGMTDALFNAGVRA